MALIKDRSQAAIVVAATQFIQTLLLQQAMQRKMMTERFPIGRGL